MAVELQKIAELLKRKGFRDGAKYVSQSAGVLEKAGFIPHKLSSEKPFLAEEENKWGIWKVIKSGGKDRETLEKELKQEDINVSEYAQDLMRSKDFVTSKSPKNIKLARLIISELGFSQAPTTDQLIQRIKKDPDLRLLKLEDAVALRLQYKDQSLEESLYAGMEPITVSDGRPNVFRLSCYEGGLWLYAGWADPDDHWDLGFEIVFRLRK